MITSEKYYVVYYGIMPNNIYLASLRKDLEDCENFSFITNHQLVDPKLIIMKILNM